MLGFWIDQIMLPLVASVYCAGLIFAASSFGADLVTEFASEMMIMAVFIVVIYAGALFDMWKSDSMSFSSHRPYNPFLMEKIRVTSSPAYITKSSTTRLSKRPTMRTTSWR